MGHVIILVGISGSGKSTWAKQYCIDQERLGFTTRVVSADHYFERDGTYQFEGSKIAAAHSFCKRNFELAISEGVTTIVVDNTNTRQWERQEYINTAKAAGYGVWLKVFDTPLEVCAERNVHGVPLDSCKKQKARIDVVPGFYCIWEAK